MPGWKPHAKSDTYCNTNRLAHSYSEHNTYCHTERDSYRNSPAYATVQTTTNPRAKALDRGLSGQELLAATRQVAR